MCLQECGESRGIRPMFCSSEYILPVSTTTGNINEYNTTERSGVEAYYSNNSHADSKAVAAVAAQAFISCPEAGRGCGTFTAAGVSFAARKRRIHE